MVQRKAEGSAQALHRKWGPNLGSKNISGYCDLVRVGEGFHFVAETL
jgi:hypothetical protein